VGGGRAGARDQADTVAVNWRNSREICARKKKILGLLLKSMRKDWGAGVPLVHHLCDHFSYLGLGAGPWGGF